jgi:SAM-dependent methyltransferase
MKKNISYFIKRFYYGFKNNGHRYILIILKRIYGLIYCPVDVIFKENIRSFEGKRIIEIGGPSFIFSPRGLFPFYSLKKAIIDNVNFSNKTIWEKSITSKQFVYKNLILGKQYIHDAGDLKSIKNNEYDILISSEMIQHSANPIKVLLEFKRVLKKRGIMIITIPYKNKTFDHKRDTTKISHLVSDYKQNMPESDMTHLSEILEKHDLSMDLLAGDFDSFRKRCLDNFNLRGMHHHCFDLEAAEKMFQFVNFEIIKSKIHKNLLIFYLSLK